MTVLPSPVQHRHHPYHLLGKMLYKMEVLFPSLLSHFFNLIGVPHHSSRAIIFRPFNLFKAIPTFTVIAEPVGSSKPKFSLGTESLAFTRSQSEELSLLCPAQGFPKPSYRLETCKSHSFPS